MPLLNRNTSYLIAHADGAIGNGRGPGAVGAIIMDAQGQVVSLRNQRIRQMTNNEAEYAGLLLALELAKSLRPRKLAVYLDSQVVVGQMNGDCAVRSAALQAWHRKACAMVRSLAEVTFSHVPRERNMLADALANEALQGRLLHIP